MKKKSMKKGFTLIETLVAITILMVAIAGPLDIAEKGLIAADNSKDQTIASFLAEDLMEYVKNIRDGNVINSNVWLTMSPSSCSTGSYCVAETATGNYTNPSISLSSCTATSLVSGVGGCELYMSASNNYYTYISNGNQATQFYRTFTITQPSGLTGNDVNNERLLTVYVSWVNGSLQSTLTLQSMIYNNHR